jgi:hypothetical protein
VVTQDPRRGTGRTTRMLELAKSLDAQGRAVYVVVAEGTVGLAREKLAGTSVKVESTAFVANGNFNLETMTLRGAHPRCVVLVDHWVIERRYPAMLAELHRYDADPRQKNGDADERGHPPIFPMDGDL